MFNETVLFRVGYYTNLNEITILHTFVNYIRVSNQGDKFAMYIIYPYDTDGLAAVAKNLTADILSKALMKRGEKLITLRLPKFKFESTAELVSILKQVSVLIFIK